MGEQNSKPKPQRQTADSSISTPPLPPKKLTGKPWREPSKWNVQLENQIKEEIQKLNPVKKANLLLLGHVGAGKSSFINTVLGISKGRKYELAYSGDALKSYTLDLKRYTDNNLLKMYDLLDSMGIEQGDEDGFHPDDVFALINGHIKRGYTFNPRKPITADDAKYRHDPDFNHQAHCVVFVVSAKAIVSGLPDGYIKKIHVLQDRLKRKGIPRILILTKVDTLCEIVEQDITKLFWSVKVQEAVKVASEVFNIATASIHPVQNYETDFNIRAITNIHLLLPLKQAMGYAVDRVEYILEVDVSSEESDGSD